MTDRPQIAMTIDYPPEDSTQEYPIPEELDDYSISTSGRWPEMEPLIRDALKSHGASVSIEVNPRPPETDVSWRGEVTDAVSFLEQQVMKFPDSCGGHCSSEMGLPDVISYRISVCILSPDFSTLPRDEIAVYVRSNDFSELPEFRPFGRNALLQGSWTETRYGIEQVLRTAKTRHTGQVLDAQITVPATFPEAVDFLNRAVDLGLLKVDKQTHSIYNFTGETVYKVQIQETPDPSAQMKLHHILIL